MNHLICSFLISLFFCGTANALTPIARVDVVPHQRIEYGATFNFGVVAFSKAGIDRIDFVISGQGYSGGTKTATSMTYNSQSDVYEYWVPIASSEFTSNGAITVTATAVGDDAGSRELAAITLYVYGTSAYVPVQIWVDNTGGDDGTCEVDNIALPCETIGSAVAKARTANGGTDNGNEILLQAGTYYIASLNPSVTAQWLAIKNAVGVASTDAIIRAATDSSHRYGSGFHFQGITLLSAAPGYEVLMTSSGNRAWIDGCRLIGSGSESSATNPVGFSGEDYSTDNYLYDMDYGFFATDLVRGTSLEKIGNDAFQNTNFVVNCTLTNISNSPTPANHADAYQTHATGVPSAENKIVYNYKATSVHYQGLFLRAGEDVTPCENNAFVNVVIEMREPPDVNETGHYAFTPLSINERWNHLLIWNSTFPYSGTVVYGTVTNSSFIGNYFWQFRDSDPSEFENGNASGNEMRYNHFVNVYGVTPACTPTTKDTDESAACPHINSVEVSSDAVSTATHGDGVLYDSYLSGDFLEPIGGEVLIGAIPFATSPADIYGDVKGATSDIGAVESGDLTAPTIPTASVNGSTVTVTADETIVTTGYDAADCNLDCTTAGQDISLTSPTGSGASRTLTSATAVAYGDTCNLDCTLGTDDIEDAAGNDMVTFSNLSVTVSTPMVHGGHFGPTAGGGWKNGSGQVYAPPM